MTENRRPLRPRRDFTAKRRKIQLADSTLCTGIVVTTASPGKWREGAREVINLIVRVIPSKPAESSNAKSFEDELVAELAAMERNGPDAFVISELAKSVCFIGFKDTLPLAPSELVLRILELVASDPEIKLSYALRLSPVDYICKPRLPEATRLIDQVVSTWFPLSPKSSASAGVNPEPREPEGEDTPGDGNVRLLDLEEGASCVSRTDLKVVRPEDEWAVRWFSRNNSTLDKTNVISYIGSVVGSGYKVNLSGEDISLICEVNPIFFGISVVRDFHKWKKLSLHSIHVNAELDASKLSKLGDNTGRAPNVGGEP